MHVPRKVQQVACEAGTAQGTCFDCGIEAHFSNECDRPVRDKGKGKGKGDTTAPRLTAKALELNDDTASLAPSTSEAMLTKDGMERLTAAIRLAAVRQCIAGVIS